MNLHALLTSTSVRDEWSASQRGERAAGTTGCAPRAHLQTRLANRRISCFAWNGNPDARPVARALTEVASCVLYINAGLLTNLHNTTNTYTHNCSSVYGRFVKKSQTLRYILLG